VASLTARPNPLKSAARGLGGKAAQGERDVMKELRAEVSLAVGVVVGCVLYLWGYCYVLVGGVLL
jgi:hypothetical protein